MNEEPIIHDKLIIKPSLSIFALSLFIFLFVSFSHHCPSIAAGSPSLDAITLKLKWQHQFQFAGYYLALEKGYYRTAGLDVVILESTSQEQATEAVMKGEAQFGIGASDLVVAHSNGLPIVVLAPIFQHSPLVLLTKKNSGINHLHDLVGKRVMLEAHSDELIAYFQNEGLSRNQFIIYPHSFDPVPFIANEVDAMSAYTTDEPYQLDSNGIQYQIFSPRSSGIDFYGDTIFTSKKQIRDHPERVRAFLAASLRGWEYAFENVDESVDLIVSRYNPHHSREHLLFEAKAMRQLVIPDIVEIGYSNPGRWKHIADVYASLGMIPHDYSLEGFLYDRSKPSVHLIYIVVSGVLVVLALLFILGLSILLTKLKCCFNRG